MLFEVWAPRAGRVELHLEGRTGHTGRTGYTGRTGRTGHRTDRTTARTQPMERDPAREGWWRAAAEAGPGARYG
ncbi:malto-oligosyltrehalose trehalohydrolase, partial [Streptomyces sp. 2MCAF27]